MKQGNGRHTVHKLDALGRVLSQNIGITARKFRDRRYLHIDLNSGCGINLLSDGTAFPGSPFLLTDATERWQRPVEAIFIDHNAAAIEELRERFALSNHQWVKAECRCAHNADALLSVHRDLLAAQTDPWTLYGSVLIDPNGIDIPWDAVRTFVRHWHHIDVLLSLSATSAKRVREACPNRSATNLTFRQIPSRLGKSDTASALAPAHESDCWQRCVIIARNWAPSSYPKGFLPWQSEEAQTQLLRYQLTRAEWTAAQKKSQMILPIGPTPSTCGIRHSALSGPS